MLAFLIGVLAGLRSLTPPAATAWAARLGWLPVASPLAWIGALPSVVVLTLLAGAELVADKLPSTPARTAPPGLIARLVTGGLCGACIASAAGGTLLVGVLLGAAGGLVGCFAGYRARAALVRSFGLPDAVVAVAEDVLAITGSFWIVTRFSI